MRSKASFMGHPIHPMLVGFPIGLWVASLGADMVYLATGTPFWYEMAGWLIAFGLVGAIAAAIPGMIDYRAHVRDDPRARGVGFAHMALNFGVTGLYLVNGLLRQGGLAAEGPMLGAVVALSALGVLLLGASGWLGGELVYRFGVGFGPAEPRVTIAPESAEERARRP